VEFSELKRGHPRFVLAGPRMLSANGGAQVPREIVDGFVGQFVGDVTSLEQHVGSAVWCRPPGGFLGLLRVITDDFLADWNTPMYGILIHFGFHPPVEPSPSGVTHSFLGGAASTTTHGPASAWPFIARPSRLDHEHGRKCQSALNSAVLVAMSTHPPTKTNDSVFRLHVCVVRVNGGLGFCHAAFLYPDQKKKVTHTRHRLKCILIYPSALCPVFKFFCDQLLFRFDANPTMNNAQCY
jgi:hypothetical protein